MKVESHVFGTVDVADEKVIEFPAGLPGFEDRKRFALLHDETKEAALFLLQSVDDPDLVFSVTGPENLGVNYQFDLSAEETAALALERPEDAAIAVIVRKGDGDSPETAGLRANFMAPLVINVSARRGLQKIINRIACDVTLRSLA